MIHSSERLVHPKFLSGKIYAPISKSVLQRLIAAAFLAEGITYIKGYTLSDDVKVALDIVAKMGSRVSIEQDRLVINSQRKKSVHRIFVGEAGLSTRMFTPIAALSGNKIIFEGMGSILTRKMDFMVKTLAEFGVELQATHSYLPYTITGKLNGGEVYLDSSESSQLLSGLLFALPLVNEDSLIHVKNLKSKPYIDLTISILSLFGITIINNNYSSFKIKGNQEYKPLNIIAEGDWSGAAFWFVAAAINGEIEICGLDAYSNQADIRILDVLKLADVNFELIDDVYSVKKSKISAFEFDATDCPDLFPPLAVLAAYADGISVIKGVTRLFQKESNRALALQTEFNKQGVEISIEGDKMFVYGSKVKGGAHFNSYNDHRMAMAGSILALGADEPINILNHQCVSKSYPDFFDDLQRMC